MKRHFSWQLWLGMSGGHELHAGHQIEGSIKLISRGATVPDFFPEVPFSCTLCHAFHADNLTYAAIAMVRRFACRTALLMRIS